MKNKKNYKDEFMKGDCHGNKLPRNDKGDCHATLAMTKKGKNGGVKAKGLKKILLATLIPVTALAVGVSVLVGVLAGAGNKRMPLSSAESTKVLGSSTQIDLGEKAIDINSHDGVAALINYIDAGAGANYYNLEKDFSGVKDASKFSGKTVKLGGIVWNIMYVSKADNNGTTNTGGTTNPTKAGDIIVTLWQASEKLQGTEGDTISSAFAKTAVNDSTKTYPSSMYGTSVVRGTLVGSQCSNSAQTGLENVAQVSTWAPFTRNSVHNDSGKVTTTGFAEMLATPANMNWQSNEDPKTTMGYPWHFPNDAYGTAPTGSSNAAWHSNLNGYQNARALSQYSAWKNDTLWLPSMVETGWNDTSYVNKYGLAGSGMWNATADQRATTTGYAWLRSGSLGNASHATLLNSSGGSYGGVTTDSYAVRPALHLNLKSAARAAGCLEQDITYHTGYGDTSALPTTYVPGVKTELSAPSNWESAAPKGLEFAGWAKGSLAGSVITTLEKEYEKLDLYAIFKPKAATAASTLAGGKTDLEIISGAADASLSAELSHDLITSDLVTVTYYWKKDGELVGGTSTGYQPTLLIANPKVAETGTYTLYYTITPNQDLIEKGVVPLADEESLQFTLKVFGKGCTAVTLPTLTSTAEGGKIYVGQSISATQLTGGRVEDADGNEVTGKWEFVSEGVYTSSGKVKVSFTPQKQVSGAWVTDEDIKPLQDIELSTNAVQLKLTLNEVVPQGTGSGFTDKTINIDYGSNINLNLFVLETGATIEIYPKQNGEIAEMPYTYSLLAPAGYIPYLHSNGVTIEEGSEICKNVTSDLKLTVAYEADERPYAVYYVLNSVETGEYPSLSVNSADLDKLISGGTVYKHEGVKPTGAPADYLDDNGDLLTTTTTVAASANISQRTVDSVKGAGSVAGDGSTVVVVYLKLNEYTVKFSATGALTNAVQNKTYRYGEKLTEAGVTTPTKELSQFDGWFMDEACTQAVKFNVYTVTEDITVYAKFNMQHYKLIFDMNYGTGANQLPSDERLLGVNSVSSLPDTNRIDWNVASLFASSFGFKSTDGAGRYVIDYTTDNVPNNKNIKNIVPTAIGYTFSGWYAEGASSRTEVIRRPNASNTNLTEDTAIVLTARWTPASYTMHFDLHDPKNNYVYTKTARNTTAWDTILKSNNLDLTSPVRDGYVFQGWFITDDTESDYYSSIENASNFTDASGKPLFNISELAPVYGSAATGYNFSNITLHAMWESVDIILREQTVTETGEVIPRLGQITFKDAGGNTITSNDITNPVGMDDKITVEIAPTSGYKFVSLQVNGRTLNTSVKTEERTVSGRKVTVSILEFTVSGRDVVTEEEEDETVRYYVNVSATYTEQSYAITYDRNGGKLAVQDEEFDLSYKPSQLSADSLDRAKLPSKLIRRGYDFVGWVFTSDEEEPAFVTDDDPDSENGLYGAELFLKAPYDLDTKGYRNVTLTAKWREQAASLYLFNANYNLDYSKPAGKDYYFVTQDKTSGASLVTDMVTEIINPSRGESFVFLGWATNKGGAVVYPAVEGKNTVSYTVNADHDENNNALNLNNLYAVWQVAGVNYIVMSAKNNGSTYGGDGITMSAKTARNYSDDQLSTITLNYTWYKIYDYDQCFKEVNFTDKDGYEVYVDGMDEIVAYEKDGKIYGLDKVTELVEAPVGSSKLTYKEFDAENAVSKGYCGVKTFKNADGSNVATTNLAPNDVLEVTVTDVNDCGIYVCVVSVNETGGTKADGYGEIEIAMNKAEYRGLTFADRSVTYNTETRSAIAREMLTCGAGASISNTSGGSYLTLPDGSRLVITYKYYKGEGELRQEITDLSKIRDVGTYHIVASFAYTPDGNKGNYLDIEEIEADLVITADPISHIEYAFRHGEEIKATDVTKFTGAYDGAAYAVEATIEDETGTATPVKVTSVDDLALDIKVYRVSEDGSATEVTGATTESGKYYIEIVGLKGDAAGNYVLGTGITVKVEYTIGKVAYEVAEHIAFKGKSVDFNNEIQTISIELDEGYEIPADIEVKYTTTYEPEEEGYTGALQNIADEGNGGRYAGVYTVTVTFEFRNEAAANNYAEIESKSATLTIEKADFFGYYNQEGVDLLRDAGFVNAINAYTVGTWYDPYISSGILTNAENFALTYEYYKVAEDGTRDILASGSHAELVANSAAAVSANTLNSIIMRAGKYEVVANIRYVSAQYKNNFKEIPESERTITYVIEEVDVESVTVTWKEDFDKVVSLGAGFDYSWIKSITVEYKAAEDGTGGGTDTITTGTEIALAGIRLEGKGNNVEQTTFWKVGDFKVWLSYYGVESAAETLKVKENISAVQVEYSVDGGSSYRDVTEEGIELVESETYLFKVRFTGTDENGVSGTLEREAELKGAIKLGEENELSVKDAEEYKFGEIKVSTYKVVSAEVIWQYKIGNGAWKNMPETHEIEYAGGEIKIQAVFEDGGKQTLEAHAGEGVEIRNVSDYVVTVGRRGNYKLEDEYGFNVVPLKLEVTWDKDELTYNTYHQTPKVKTHNRAESDAETLVFEYEYTDRNGAMLTQAHVIDVGEYVVKLVLTGSARNNYTLAGSESATHEFRITQAEIEAKVTYNEHTYGENKTYAGNGSLRLKAMKADFGDKAVIEGTFAFITNYNEATGKYDVADESATKAMIANRNEALKVWYVYTPTGENDKKNYKDKVGYIEIDVQNQTARTGKGALSVEFGENSVQFYLVNQEFETAGIEVYLLYQSSYQEDEVWYGYRSKVENPTFRIGTFKADGYKITPQDLSSEKVVLNAISGSNSGTLDVSVVDKVATGLEVSSTTHRTTYYVNEAFDYSDMEFRVTFGDGNSQDGLRKGSVKTASPVVFDTEGKYTVTFTYFNVSCDVEFTVAPKQDLTIIEPSNLVLTYRNGEKLDAPQLKAVVDGITYNQSEFAEKLKISVRVEVTNKANNQTAELGALEEGVYNVRYIFTSNNPRFNTPQTKNLEVRVTTNPYELDITLPESGLSKVYTGEYIEIPKYVLNSVTDKQTETMVPNSRISVIATINGEEVTKESDWSRTALEVGAYEVVIVVKVTGSDGKEFDPVSYTLQVTKSANDGVEAKLNVKPVIYTAGVEFGFTVEAEFGADKVVYTYSKTRNGDYKTFAEVGEFSAGTWYVKATIADTKNYAGIELIEPFEVRVSGIGSDEGSIEGSITGTDGIGEGWKLTITENETEEVVIERQEVLYGYNVKLTDANNQAVELSGEYTVVITLTEEQAEALNGKSGLKMFMYDAEGKATELKEADVTVEGNKLTFKTDRFGDFALTEAIPAAAGVPIGLIVGLIVGGVAAAGMIAACVVVFLKKKRGAQQ
ncbi:MAG: InlB B-repeat-containing protein [Roseburia sp.]|nr:InlB B-repeat-containing protein [Roseburia sp.]